MFIFSDIKTAYDIIFTEGKVSSHERFANIYE